MDKPTITKNKIGNDVIINQVGCFGVYLGKIDFYLDIVMRNFESYIEILQLITIIVI